ncbi:MAG: acetylxylan esterase [Gemmataceae bacterium]
MVPAALLAGVLMAAPPSLEFDARPQHPELPDPLTMLDGTKVTTKEDWLSKRRPELKELFQEVMYGRYPTAKPQVSARVEYEDKAALNGAATLRDVTLTVAPGAPPVHVLVVVPNKRSGPVPAFVGLNFTGNHTLTADRKVRLPESWMRGTKGNKATDAGRGKELGAYPLELIVGRGYAVATAYYGDIIPDDPKVRGGLADLLMPAADASKANRTGAVMAWAWGLHRMVDYLASVPEIDAKRIASVGHSRLGKTAIVAAAFDDRIALAVPSQAGCGGTSPDRMQNPKGETVARITKAFPHWFAPRFTKFGEDPSRLPFDQNCLVAICAPRPVLFTNATDDQWADPPGQFDTLKAAAPVYKLLGVEGLGQMRCPAEGTLLDSRLGYWVRPGKHSMTPADWETYLTFADKWLK